MLPTYTYVIIPAALPTAKPQTKRNQRKEKDGKNKLSRQRKKKQSTSPSVRFAYAFMVRFVLHSMPVESRNAGTRG